MLLPVEPPTCIGQNPGTLVCLVFERGTVHVNKPAAVEALFLRKRVKAVCV